MIRRLGRSKKVQEPQGVLKHQAVRARRDSAPKVASSIPGVSETSLQRLQESDQAHSRLATIGPDQQNTSSKSAHKASAAPLVESKRESSYLSAVGRRNLLCRLLERLYLCTKLSVGKFKVRCR